MILYSEGQFSKGIYVVCAGRVKLTSASREGRTVIIKIATPGDIIGLDSTVSGKPYSASAETMQPCHLDFIKRDDLMKYLDGEPKAWKHVATHLSRDCQMSCNTIRSFGLYHSAVSKIAHLLLELSEDGKPTTIICLKHEDIGQLVGSTRETVTRTLGEFRTLEIANLHGQRLTIHNREALEEIIACG